MAVAVITKVQLPDRTRARLETESNQQRALKPHDIRTAIPLVDYTNPAKFPPYIFREYPKMPLLDNQKPIVIDESGNVLIFYDAADEVEFKQMNPEVADEIERNTPAKALADAIAAKDQEIDDLRARLRNAGLVDDDDGGARRRPVRNALTGVTGVKPPAATQASSLVPEGQGEAKEEGLRATLPPNEAGKKGGPKSNNPLKKN